jgi:hypothetical protein
MEPSSKTFILEEIPRETILKMVKLEQEWRYSKEIQDLYYQAYQENINIGTLIEDQIQQGILRNFGFNNNDKSLEEYRKIPKTYWNDGEIKSSLFYMNLNIFQYPNIQVGDELINTPLLNLDKTETSLKELSFKTNGKPLVILAGSIT